MPCALCNPFRAVATAPANAEVKLADLVRIEAGVED